MTEMVAWGYRSVSHCLCDLSGENMQMLEWHFLVLETQSRFRPALWKFTDIFVCVSSYLSDANFKDGDFSFSSSSSSSCFVNYIVVK